MWPYFLLTVMGDPWTSAVISVGVGHKLLSRKSNCSNLCLTTFLEIHNFFLFFSFSFFFCVSIHSFADLLFGWNNSASPAWCISLAVLQSLALGRQLHIIRTTAIGPLWGSLVTGTMTKGNLLEFCQSLLQFFPIFFLNHSFSSKFVRSKIVKRSACYLFHQ